MPTQFRFPDVLKNFTFQKPIVVWDVPCSVDMGVWQEAEEEAEKRTISGIVLTLKPDDLAYYNQGNIDLAGISIITDAKLYMANSDTEAGEDMQSYVFCHGIRWKVVASGLFAVNTAHHQYICVRYVY